MQHFPSNRARRYEDDYPEKIYNYDQGGFGREPVRGTTYDRGTYGSEPMSGRDYPGGRGQRGPGYAQGRYRPDEAEYRRRRGYEAEGYGPGYAEPEREPYSYDYGYTRDEYGGYGSPYPGGSSYGREGNYGFEGKYGTEGASESGYGWSDNRATYRRRYNPEPTYQRGRTFPYTEPWMAEGPHRGRGPEGYQRSEDRIREDVCERLTWHGAIDATDITIEVVGDEVTLEGTVDSRRAKRIAEDLAESVTGVWDVHNRLRIARPEERSRAPEESSEAQETNEQEAVA